MEIGKNPKDFTCNGKCSNCGNCCIPWIPITNYEKNKIEKYIKDNNIKLEPLIVADKNIYLDCCFHDRVNKKCKIYEVRPEVCSNFICSNSMEIIDKDRNHYDNRADINGSTGKLVPLDLLFYNRLDTLIYTALMVLKNKNIPTNKDNLKNVLGILGYKDKEIKIILEKIELESD